MRGVFNSTMSVRYGSRSVIGPPGVIYAVDIPCRLVVQREIDQLQFDFSLAGAWVTNDVVDLNGPYTSSPWLGAIFTDQLAADEVQFSPMPDEWWSVCRVEAVRPYGQDAYRRALVIPLSSIQFPLWPPPVSPPPPPPPPPPGPCGGSCEEACHVAFQDPKYYALAPGLNWWTSGPVDAGVYSVYTSMIGTFYSWFVSWGYSCDDRDSGGDLAGTGCFTVEVEQGESIWLVVNCDSSGSFEMSFDYEECE